MSRGEGKQLRERIEANRANVTAHLAKIADELAKPQPDYGLVAHWKGEIRGWEKTVERLEARLVRRRRRGR